MKINANARWLDNKHVVDYEIAFDVERELTSRIRQLEAALKAAMDGLRIIERYGKDHEGCCPYGFDTPTIATDALAEIQRLTGGEK